MGPRPQTPCGRPHEYTFILFKCNKFKTLRLQDKFAVVSNSNCYCIRVLVSDQFTNQFSVSFALADIRNAYS